MVRAMWVDADTVRYVDFLSYSLQCPACDKQLKSTIALLSSEGTSVYISEH